MKHIILKEIASLLFVIICIVFTCCSTEGDEPYLGYENIPNNGSNQGDDDNGGGNGGSNPSTPSTPSTKYEAPEVSFYDETSYSKSKIKITYKIWNKDKTKISSAKIYYGTSSNPSKSASTSISGVLITATISGLKAGNDYYFKCVVKWEGGTVTTDVTRLYIPDI